MKKTWAVLLTAVVAAATLGVASPARAQGWPTDCLESDGGLGLQTVTVDLENGVIEIDHTGVVNDVNYVAAVTTALAWCLENDYVVGTANCLLTKLAEILVSIDVGSLDLRYVSVNLFTGEILIDYGRLVTDAGECVPVLGIG